MKKIVLLSLLAMSCGKGSDGNDGKDAPQKTKAEQLAESKEKWLKDKPQLYTYTVTRTYGSDWNRAIEAGDWSSMIVVENDVVICRAFKQTGSVEREYKEEGDDIGSNDFGFNAKTMDDLYSGCDTLLGSKNDDLLFSLDDSGLLKSCFTRLTQEQQNEVPQGIDNSIHIDKFFPGVNKCDTIIVLPEETPE